MLLSMFSLILEKTNVWHEADNPIYISKVGTLTFESWKTIKYVHCMSFKFDPCC